MIDYIKIFGLHGDRDISLEFHDKTKIIVGENGSGKTTVLSALYACLSGKFEALAKTEFKNIQLKFKNSDSITIDKKFLPDDIDIRKIVNHPNFLDDEIPPHILLDAIHLA